MEEHNLALLAQMHGRKAGIRDVYNVETSKAIIQLLRELQFGNLLDQLDDNFIRSRISPVSQLLVQIYQHAKEKVINRDESMRFVFKCLQKQSQHCVTANEWSQALQVLFKIGHALFNRLIAEKRQKYSDSDDEQEKTKNTRRWSS